MNFKILCTDIDGTLLNKNRELSERTITALKKIKDDVLIVLASSRMPSAMKHLQKEIGIVNNPMICYNGGLILGFDEKIEFSMGIPLEILSLLNKREDFKYCNISTYVNDDWFTQYADHWTEREEKNTKVNSILERLEKVIEQLKIRNESPQKIMCMGDASRIDSILENLKAQNSSDLNFYRSKDTYLELSHKKIDKAKALAFLIDQKIIKGSSEEVISFGDNYNDIELLKYSGYGVAVENARQELKNVASVVTKSNIEDGVAFLIEKVFSLK